VVIDYFADLAKKPNMSPDEIKGALGTLKKIIERWGNDEDVLELHSSTHNKLNRLLTKKGGK